jgi:hypothetical protein
MISIFLFANPAATDTVFSVAAGKQRLLNSRRNRGFVRSLADNFTLS